MKNTGNIANRSIELNKLNNIDQFVSILEDVGYVFIDSKLFQKLQDYRNNKVALRDVLVVTFKEIDK
ncbi:hypothetical protein [Psychrobacter immobilis]|uniref:hypothetical protein n=1 Tax=Psychrobacter immobilis TaxID=498 RepID=UPI0028E5C4D0|nr:hypothetical protein [Psychrobacter immobilis]